VIRRLVARRSRRACAVPLGVIARRWLGRLISACRWSACRRLTAAVCPL